MKVMGAATLVTFIAVMSEVGFYSDPAGWWETFQSSMTELWNKISSSEVEFEVPTFAPWTAFSWPTDLPLSTQMPLIVSGALLSVQMAEKHFKMFYRKWHIEDWNEANTTNSGPFHDFFIAFNRRARLILEGMLLFPAVALAFLKRKGEDNKIEKIKKQLDGMEDGEAKEKLKKEKDELEEGFVDDERVAEFIKNNPKATELKLTNCYNVQKVR